MTAANIRQTDFGFGYKKDQLDPRDHVFGTLVNPRAMKQEFDLTGLMPPVYDQGQLGSCTGNGIAGIMEYEEMRQGEGSTTPSRLYIYYHERVLEGTVDQDAGAEIRDGMKVVASLGVPPETDWPYDINRFTERPPDQAETDATQHKAIQYARVIPGHGHILAALAAGFPVVFGFSVPAEFENLSSANPLLRMPGPNTQWIGGHCVVAVGYDWTRTRFDGHVLKVRNSWGENWGEAGYFYMESPWFVDQSLTSDFWVARKVS